MSNSLQYLVLLLTLGALSVFFYQDFIALFPAYNHSWTKSDKLALVYGFLDNNFNLFKPQTYNLISKGGVTGVDFALHEYLVAGLMKLLGTRNPMVFKVYSLAVSWIGYVYLFRLSKLFNQSFGKSLLIVVFTFSLPILAYYQAGYLPSTTAFATVFIGYYYYLSFRKKENYNHFYLALFFMLISALVRTPYSIFMFAILLEHLLYWRNQKIFIKKEWLGFLTVVLLIVAANLYKIYLNRMYGTIFLNSLMPPDSLIQLKELSLHILKKWNQEIMTRYHAVLIGISVVGLLVSVFIRKIQSRLHSILLRQVILTSLGGAAFFVIMIKQFVDHEYYFIDSFYVAVVFLFLTGISALNFRPLLLRILLLGVGVGLLCGALYESKNIQEVKNNLTVGGRGETTIYNYYGSDVFLDSLGVSRSAKILVIDGYTPNAPLILMGRKGYSLTSSKASIVKALLDTVDFVVQQNIYFLSDVLRDNPYLVNRLKRIGGNEKISVFKVQPFNSNQQLRNLLTDKEPVLVSLIDMESGDPTEGWYNTLETSTENVFRGDFSGVLTEEFGPTFVWEDHYLDFTTIIVEGYFYSDGNGMNGQQVAVTFFAEEKQIAQKYLPLEMGMKNQWVKQQFKILVPQGKNISKMKLFLWNPSQQKIYYDDLVLTLF